jgi:7-cyano-7-deazaguanine synthase in queuosine biosynthesis
MKITHDGQSIDLFGTLHFPTGAPDSIVLSLSGGCDSASLAYLIATHFPDTEIIPFTARDEDCPIDADHAVMISKFLQNEFPNGKINDLEIFEIKTTDPEWLKKAQDARDAPSGKIMVNGQLEYKWRTLKGTSKALQNRHIRYSMAKKHNTYVVTGMSCNPPVDEMQRLGFYDVAERKRDPGSTSALILDDITYNPYLYVDKKFVAGVYHDHSLMERLYPLTKSCAWTKVDGNENYPEACGKCFWCHERKWAFE